MKTYINLWQYVAEFVLKREIFRTKFIEKIRRFMINNFFPEILTDYEIMCKNIVQP